MRLILRISTIFLLALMPTLALAQSTSLNSTLSWTNPDTTDAIEIDKAPAQTGPFSKLTTVPAGTTSFVDSANAAGQTACYELRYFNSSGVGPVSNVACKTFPPVPTQAPASLNVQ